ncbi:MAG: ABC transporter ATP-binding protein, partial [Litoreibacter sp.]
MIRNAGNLIDAFQKADGPPPRTLLAFFKWALAGSFPMLAVAATLSAAAGTAEVFTALILGHVIDTAIGSGADGFFSANVLTLLGVLAFFVFLRPVLFGLSPMANAVVVQPNVNPLVLSRLHRWTLGQSVTFFDDDFAGRIAQKQLQTARAVTDVASETINVVFFALASLIGSALLLTTINGWMALTLGLWVIGYLLMIRWFMPRIRVRSKARANARAMVTGQVVDTVTNIKTVKLFAHADHEEHEALDAIGTFREKVLDYGVIAATFQFCLMTVAGMVPVMLIGGTLWFWSIGAASPGDIAAAGAISIRIAQMSGWVSHTLMAIYASIGEAEDGMNTLTPAHTLTDKGGAASLVLEEPSIKFEGVNFAYGRQSGGIEYIDLTIAPGEKIGIVGASGAGKSTLVALLMRLYDSEAGRVLVGGVDVRDVTQESLRRQIGMVTQETAMFNRS